MHIVVPDNLDQVGLDLLAQTSGVTYEAFKKLPRPDLMAMGGKVDGLIIRSASTIDREMFEALPNLKAIARAGVGVDNVDLEEATRRGVVVMNAPDGNTIATAELSMGLMLALARHIPQAHTSMQARKWDRAVYMGTELRGKTLGVVGFGRVGQAVAKRALAFEMKVIAYDPYVPPSVAEELGTRLLGSLDEVYAQADYITLHSVLTPETREMINAASISKMKDGVRIINVARGALVNEADLAAALKSGKVAGAAVDVYPEEPPPPDNPLVGLPNVIDTPHLGASTEEAQLEVAIQATNNLLNALLKKEYRNVVNPDVLKKRAG